jgi:hypothetical protein
MKREFIFDFAPDGTVLFAAYCLRTDSWHDYLAFMTDAECSIAVGDLRNSNRFLRAALICLFGHIEGVVNEIHKQKKLPKTRKLSDRINNVEQEAKKCSHVPFINFNLEKTLRDLIAHPGICKTFSQKQTEETILDQNSVFEHLSIANLRKFERQINIWLDQVCVNLKVLRFTDTNKHCEDAIDFLKGLGASKTSEI